MQPHQFLVHLLTGIHQSLVELVVRRVRQQHPDHTLRLHQGSLLLFLRRSGTLLAFALILLQRIARYLILGAQHRHHLLVQRVNPRLTACRRCDDERLRIHAVLLSVVVGVGATGQQRTEHRTGGEDVRQQILILHTLAHRVVRRCQQWAQPLGKGAQRTHLHTFLARVFLLGRHVLHVIYPRTYQHFLHTLGNLLVSGS